MKENVCGHQRLTVENQGASQVVLCYSSQTPF